MQCSSKVPEVHIYNEPGLGICPSYGITNDLRGWVFRQGAARV